MINDVVDHFAFAYLLLNLVFKSGEWVKLILYREAPLRDPAPYPFIHSFDRKDTPFVFSLLTRSHT